MFVLCAACIALVEELNWLTGITNPKLKIQVGSFHLDAKGNSGAKEVSGKLDDKLINTEVHRPIIHNYNKHVCQCMSET